jgi:hypothetical protein
MRIPSVFTRAAAYAAVGIASSAATLALVFFVSPAVAASPWAWHVGDDVSGVGRPAGSSDLSLTSTRDTNIYSTHIRLGAIDGNFEFETDAPMSHLNAYTIGSPNRVPVWVGGDEGQDVLGFDVVGQSGGQKADLQDWQLGSRTVASIDGTGHLHLGGLVLSGRMVNGHPQLLAQLPSGKQVILAKG